MILMQAFCNTCSGFRMVKAERLVRFEPETFQFSMQCLNAVIPCFNVVWVMYILRRAFGRNQFAKIHSMTLCFNFIKKHRLHIHFSYEIFSRFIFFTFRNYFALCKIVLCIWIKIIFFCHHNFMKKVILICLKMNLKISHKLR